MKGRLVRGSRPLALLRAANQTFSHVSVHFPPRVWGNPRRRVKNRSCQMARGLARLDFPPLFLSFGKLHVNYHALPRFHVGIKTSTFEKATHILPCQLPYKQNRSPISAPTFNNCRQILFPTFMTIFYPSDFDPYFFFFFFFLKRQINCSGNKNKQIHFCLN